MLETWNLGARFYGQLRIDVGGKNTRLGPTLRQNLAPGTDDQAVSVGSPAIGVQAALRRRDHEGAILDRPRAQQNVPVRLAGGLGESRWRGEGEGAFFGHLAIKLWKADVVTDRKTDLA